MPAPVARVAHVGWHDGHGPRPVRPVRIGDDTRDKGTEMPLSGEYEPSTSQRSREQVELYKNSGGTEGTTMRDMPVIILTSRGAQSGKIRKTPLMRVEHE